MTAISDEGTIFAAWTEDFLIKAYDASGNYQRAVYYPYKNRTVNLAELDISVSRQEFLTDDNTPDTWPALHTMEVDDKNRLWVLTITDSDSTYKGWVLNLKGELLAKFDWPGERTSRSVRVRPMFLIKSGFLYTRERDIREGIDRIVKHKVNFAKQ